MFRGKKNFIAAYGHDLELQSSFCRRKYGTQKYLLVITFFVQDVPIERAAEL
jgi:hypothetical protein